MGAIFAEGDPVVIVAKDHPWFGEAGVIDRRSPVPGFDWEVELNGTYLPTCGVAAHEIRLVAS